MEKKSTVGALEAAETEEAKSCSNEANLAKPQADKADAETESQAIPNSIITKPPNGEHAAKRCNEAPLKRVIRNKSKEKKTTKRWSDVNESKKNKKKRRGTPGFTRRLWNDVEDDAISTLVIKYGIKKWTLISRKLKEEYGISGRSGKQCRERYILD